MAEQAIVPGQIWRRIKSGKHIRITRERVGHAWDGAVIRTDDWSWEGVDYKGRGVSYGSYIRRDCELVSTTSNSETSR